MASGPDSRPRRWFRSVLVLVASDPGHGRHGRLRGVPATPGHLTRAEPGSRLTSAGNTTLEVVVGSGTPPRPLYGRPRLHQPHARAPARPRARRAPGFLDCGALPTHGLPLAGPRTGPQQLPCATASPVVWHVWQTRDQRRTIVAVRYHHTTFASAIGGTWIHPAGHPVVTVGRVCRYDLTGEERPVTGDTTPAPFLEVKSTGPPTRGGIPAMMGIGRSHSSSDQGDQLRPPRASHVGT